jgi:hypothetical protein
LATATSDESFTEEVEDRLDNIFGDLEDTPPAESKETPVVEHPLRDLKTIVLSIDWEITGDVMTGFVEQVALLQDKYRQDKIVLVFLQLLGSIGEYIRTQLGKSHPEAFKILTSLFDQLEKVVLSKSMSEIEKKKILSAELEKYKKLKIQLHPQKVPKEKKTVAAAPVPKAPTQQRQGLVEVIQEMKTDLMAEIRSLKEEIKSLKAQLKNLAK